MIRTIPARPRGRRETACESGRRAQARRIYDFVRACDYAPFASPWGTPVAQLDGKEVKVPKVGLTGERCDAAPGTLREGTLVATADEWLLLRRKGS